MEEKEVKKKKKKILFHKDRFYEDEIDLVRRAMSKCKDKQSEEYKRLFETEKMLQEARKKKAFKVNWDAVMKGLELAVKILTGAIVPIGLACFMYSKDEKMLMKSKSVERIFDRTFKP